MIRAQSLRAELIIPSCDPPPPDVLEGHGSGDRVVFVIEYSGILAQNEVGLEHLECSGSSVHGVHGIPL